MIKVWLGLGTKMPWLWFRNNCGYGYRKPTLTVGRKQKLNCSPMLNCAVSAPGRLL